MTIFSNDTSSSGYAFFDVDETLISIKTMFCFLDYWYSVYPDEAEQAQFHMEMSKIRKETTSWEIANRRYYQYFAGRSVKKVADCAVDWFNHLQQNTKPLFYDNVVAELREHQAKNREIVFVSGSFPALLAPVAKHLNVNHILATNMEIQGECYTGEILPPQTIGAGKAEAVSTFLKQVNFEAENCYAYGDDISDLPMLMAVGHPAVISGGRGLEAHAKEVGWRIVHPF